MATISAFPAHPSICKLRNVTTTSNSSLTVPFGNFHFQNHGISNGFRHLTVKAQNLRILPKVRAVEEETVIPEQQQEDEEVGEGVGNVQEEGTALAAEQPAVTVPISSSDTLTMFFQAEGAMNEAAIPTVIKALEEMEGITNLKVQVAEGIASVQLEKQTTVQATGVASSLVESIQSSGFKLQTLNLSFDDQEDIVV